MATTAAPTQQTTLPVPQFTQPASSLYVGDIVPEVTEAVLFDLFNKVGPVASVRVCRDAATRRSLGYAYVNFHRSDDAERALDTLNFTDIAGRPCRLMWSHRDPSLRKSGVGNIFVKYLTKEIDNKTLYDSFSVFGNILSCKVATNSKRESLGYGFVHFESEDSARECISKANGNLLGGLGGLPVEVTAFKSKKERGGSDKDKFTNVYVKNLPEDTTDEKLRLLFAPFGKITSAYVNADENKMCRGFGFVNFETAEMAAAAIEKLHNSELGAAPGKKLFVSRAQKKEEREKELRDRFEAIKLERQKKQANLYVKNLADTIDENRLRAEFSKFGNITSAKVMLDEKNKSRGFGFVCFTTAEEASKAVTEMNSKMLEHKPLYVALAQRKEYRRAQLEAQHAQRQRNQQANMMFVPPQGPMFFPPGGMMPGANRFFAPQQQQMGMRRWPPVVPGQNPQMMMRPGATPNGFQLVPASMAGMNNVPQRGMPNGRGGRGPRNQGGHRRPNQGVSSPQQQQQMNIKYQPGAQNIRPQMMASVGQAEQAVQQMSSAPVPESADNAVGEQEPLTIKVLAAAAPEQQKQMLGERLFPLVQRHQPELAGKITGMLLEMENGELLHLLENPQALREKVMEAMEVLQQAGVATGGLEPVADQAAPLAQ